MGVTLGRFRNEFLPDRHGDLLRRRFPALVLAACALFIERNDHGGNDQLRRRRGRRDAPRLDGGCDRSRRIALDRRVRRERTVQANVLKQSGRGDFPWCVKNDTQIVDGYVEVKFKPVSGKEDQAGGVVWRWKDGDNYYVARANALENNVSLYYTQNGRRITIKYVDAPVARNEWHTLRVDFAGQADSGRARRQDLHRRSTTSTSRAPAASACGPRPTASRLFDDFTYGTEVK